MNTAIMQGSPPPASAQVTLANWREAPFSRWAFHHVREIVPTARIACDPANVAVLPESGSGEDVLDVAFTDPGGINWSIRNLLPESFTDSFIALRRGAPLLEWQGPHCAPGEPHIIFSVSKSLTACLTGVLVGDGMIDPDLPVTAYVPEATGSAYGDCTVRHVLDMSVGIEFEESYLDTTGAFEQYRRATGWNPAMDEAEAVGLRQFLTTLTRDGHAHGEMFHYVSPNSDMLGWIVERASGRRFSELFSDLIWKPLGAASNCYITLDRFGAPRSAGGMCVTASDLARFAEMMRRGGEANGRQIIPQNWVEDTTHAGSREAWMRGATSYMFPNGRYRSKWYQTGNERGAYCAIGIHGQWIYVDSVAEMVFVRLSSQPLPLDDPCDLRWLAAFDAVARQFA